MRGLMVCGEFPDIRCGRITLALKNHGVTHGVTTLRVPPQLGHVYDFIDWNHTDGAKRLIDRALAHDPDIYHVHGELHQFWPVVELKKRTDKPVILNVHDLASARPGTALDRYEEEAIDAAAQGDFSVVDDLFTLAQNPFEEHPEFERWAQATPQAFKNQRLSCSS